MDPTFVPMPAILLVSSRPMGLECALAHLVGLCPPPERPVAADGNFAAVFSELGATLPSDWVALVSRYGYGTFGDHVHLWSPFFLPCTMMDQARVALEADRALARMHPKAVPFALFPDAQGALPWANTDNGDVAYWLTESGTPDRWLVAVWNPRSGQEPSLHEGALDWISTWLEASDSRWFDPWRERTHLTIAIADAANTPFVQRLARLQDVFGPVVARGGYGDEDGEKRQVHFLASAGAWRLTYDTVYGHSIRVAAPKDELASAEAAVDRALRSMGCTRAQGAR